MLSRREERVQQDMLVAEDDVASSAMGVGSGGFLVRREIREHHASWSLSQAS